MIPCVELHGRSVGHGSMHGIVWNHTDHMLPCMELHGSLMNLDPGKHHDNSKIPLLTTEFKNSTSNSFRQASGLYELCE